MFALRSESKQKKRFEIEALPHIQQLYSAARRLTRRDSDAEDLVQDTFLRGYLFFDRFQPGTNLRAWLFKIMTNLFINKYRRRVTEGRVLAEGKEDTRVTMLSPALVEYCKDPEGVFFSGLFGDDVQRALDDLNEDFRMVVLLADVHEFSYKEIADILACPVGTVMSRLFRGRRALQSKLVDCAHARGIGLGHPEAVAAKPAARAVVMENDEGGEVIQLPLPEVAQRLRAV